MSLGCLSLCDYVPLPREQKYMGLTTMIKRALGQMHAAPEILLTIFDHVLDPRLRWFISALRLYVHCTKTAIGKQVLAHLNLSRRNSRLAGFVRTCLSMGWTLNSHWLYFHDDECHLHRDWDIVKGKVIKNYNYHMFQKTCQSQTKAV